MKFIFVRRVVEIWGLVFLLLLGLLFQGIHVLPLYLGKVVAEGVEFATYKYYYVANSTPRHSGRSEAKLLSVRDKPLKGFGEGVPNYNLQSPIQRRGD